MYDSTLYEKEGTVSVSVHPPGNKRRSFSLRTCVLDDAIKSYSSKESTKQDLTNRSLPPNNDRGHPGLCRRAIPGDPDNAP